MIKQIIFLFFIFFSIFLFSCNEIDEKESLKVGIIPFENAEELLKNISPFLEVISEGLDTEIEPFMAADYTGVIEAFRAGKLDFAFLSPASYIMGKQEAGIKVILKSQRGGNPFYYGTIITRVDSGIDKISDLKDRNFSFGDPLSTSGHVFPRMLLVENGINPDTDFKNLLYSGAHDATVLAVLNNKVDAGATFSDDKNGTKGAWTRYLNSDEIKQIKTIGTSLPIPSDNICVSKDLDPKVIKKLTDVILNYGKTEEGKNMLKNLYKFDGYVKASDDDYQVVREAFNIAGIKIEKVMKKK